MAVGVFDSGLGGLTVLDALTRRLPDTPFVYLGDNAHAPYGTRTPDDIFALTCAARPTRFPQPPGRPMNTDTNSRRAGDLNWGRHGGRSLR